jgi:hypothetical protein
MNFYRPDAKRSSIKPVNSSYPAKKIRPDCSLGGSKINREGRKGCEKNNPDKNCLFIIH